MPQHHHIDQTPSNLPICQTTMAAKVMTAPAAKLKGGKTKNVADVCLLGNPPLLLYTQQHSEERHSYPTIYAGCLASYLLDNLPWHSHR